MGLFGLLCFLYSLPGPPKIHIDTFAATIQLYPVNKRLCPNFDPNRDVTFNLYTQKNRYTPQVLQIGNDMTLKQSNINFNNPTVIFFDGFTERFQNDNSQTIKNSYLKRGEYNVILVDAERLVAAPFYITSVLNAKPVGNYTATLVDYLVKKGLKLTNLHVIGMSLGAHMAGFVGKNIKSGRLPRITGLDPAGPLFDLVSPSERLATGDAEFVDVIHTNRYIFGIRFSIGDVDIYFNGGTFQPGCDPINAFLRDPTVLANIILCNHYQAWRYYSETVLNPKAYSAVKCDNYHDYKKGKCNDNNKTYVGVDVSRTARGDYYVNAGITPVKRRE